MKPIIDLINVDKSYGDLQALKGVSAQIMERGVFFVTWPFRLWKNNSSQNNSWI